MKTVGALLSAVVFLSCNNPKHLDYAITEGIGTQSFQDHPGKDTYGK